MKVKFDRVSFTYGSTEALKDVSCEFGSGRTVLVVGHNGSGKSTFLRLMNGILKPSNGEVRLGDTSTREKPVSELARRCALSFQNPDDQLFAQTVAKELRFGIDNIGGDGSLLGPVIEAFHLGEHLESNPYSLTYALRRLVAIAGSGAMNTPILALDEPTAGLSLREKNYLGNLISLLKGRGKTIVIVTHDLNFLLPYADDVLMLRRGEVQFTGSRDDLFARADGRKLMLRSGISYPVYARISSAVGSDGVRFTAEEIIDGLIKKRAGTTLRTNGQRQLEGA
ncbi:MAG TPA: ABC transporter ATP-binding protein [Candidatus Kryptobacter bacterium]|nr:ABC transporter ATP-binding protein [Candidatus Kryptobacter bacterium]